VRRPLALTGLLVLLAGGAGTYALRASGDTDGCPRPEDLPWPVIDFRQEPDHYVTVTLTNPNPCYGFDNEPVEITLYGPNRMRGISYTGEGPLHGDVGVCCNVTLPPHGTWTMRFGNQEQPNGSRQWRICNIRVDALKSVGYSVWKRMPEGGHVTGRASFPPDHRPGYLAPDYTRPVPPLSDDPTWREPCES